MPNSAAAALHSAQSLRAEKCPGGVRSIQREQRGEQGDALSDRAGATAQIREHLRSGRGVVKTLNAIFSNVYKNNPELLTGWKTVSRVQKSGGGGEAPAPAPTPPA